MGRKALPEGDRRRQYTVQLTPVEAEALTLKYGSVNGAMRLLVEGGVAPVPKAASPRPAGISPYSGKPLCPDCRRKGPNVHCPECGANARGAK